MHVRGFAAIAAEVAEHPHSRPEANNFLRHRMREATAEAHFALDRQFAQLNLRDRSDYRIFLQCSASALLPLEAELVEGGVERVFPDWEGRLAALESKPLSLLAKSRPLNGAAMFGTMYVLEGSRLGAKFLLETVLTSADPLVADTTGYLRHGEGLPFWRSFLTKLERYSLETDCDLASVIDAAQQAFDLFENAANRVFAAADGETLAGLPPG